MRQKILLLLVFIFLFSLVCSQEITWAPCSFFSDGRVSNRPAECATIPVVGNYNTLEGSINLFVKKIVGSNAGDNQLWMVADGPGLSGSMYELIANQLISDLNEQYSIFLMDHRGTGKSSPTLNCPTNSVSREPPEGDCISFLDNTYGETMEYYTSDSIAQDYIAIRSKLPTTGNVLFYGTGYGSYIINQILSRNDSTINAVVLDSYRYPSLATSDIDAQLIGLQFIEQCELVDSCRAQLQNNDPEEILREIFNRFDGLNCINILNFQRHDLQTAFRNMLQDPLLRLLILPVSKRIIRCNADDQIYLRNGLPNLTGLFNEQTTNNSLTNLGESYVLRNQIDINEFLPVRSSETQPTTSALDQTSRALYFSNYYASFINTLGRSWPWKYSPEINPYSFANTAVPTLLLAGQYDAITPVFKSQPAAISYNRPLQRSIVIPFATHSVFFTSPTLNGNDCGYDLVVQFFSQTGVWNPNQLTTECLNNLTPIDFGVESQSTRSISNSLFGDPNAWGTGDIPNLNNPFGLPTFSFDSPIGTQNNELPTLPRLPISEIVVYDTYDTSQAVEPRSTISFVKTVFYPNTRWATPSGAFEVIVLGDSSHLESWNLLNLIVIFFSIYLLNF